ncbi:MAG: hypothetical protein PHO13_08690 [Fermentimonas sp.]|jgi:hypothetical protein|nr:hypothetical protein [Fermentimonas sp.]MDD4283672.1 hypothetical protein [Fermentimonas sp.]MDD4725007.1 hypothetical protein [Fermentimonas sp.]NLC86129.1 hypothetical protein [Bacteroidales bacterium]HBT84899.1 hypothetical protein [Porphyromonadaceae bacterium]
MKTKFNKLKEIDKSNNPFKVPENYFAQFNEDIINRLPEKEFYAPKQVPLWDKVKPWIYLAAMFVGMYFTINFILKRSENSVTIPQTIVSEQLSTVKPGNENYWSTVNMSEEEFYQFLEEQLVDEVYFDYMYNQYYLN